MKPGAGLLLFAALCLGGCDDGSAGHLVHAQQQYRALVDAEVDPRDPRYDAVLDELKQVKPGSNAGVQAERLTQALTRARGRAAPTPLAVSGRGEEDEDLAQARDRCAALAAQLGALEGAAREAKKKELAQCQHDALAVDLAHAHGEPLPDGGH